GREGHRGGRRQREAPARARDRFEGRHRRRPRPGHGAADGLTDRPDGDTAPVVGRVLVRRRRRPTVPQVGPARAGREGGRAGQGEVLGGGGHRQVAGHRGRGAGGGGGGGGERHRRGSRLVEGRAGRHPAPFRQL